MTNEYSSKFSCRHDATAKLPALKGGSALACAAPEASSSAPASTGASESFFDSRNRSKQRARSLQIFHPVNRPRELRVIHPSSAHRVCTPCGRGGCSVRNRLTFSSRRRPSRPRNRSESTPNRLQQFFSAPRVINSSSTVVVFSRSAAPGPLAADARPPPPTRARSTDATNSRLNPRRVISTNVFGTRIFILNPNSNFFLDRLLDGARDAETTSRSFSRRVRRHPRHPSVRADTYRELSGKCTSTPAHLRRGISTTHAVRAHPPPSALHTGAPTADAHPPWTTSSNSNASNATPTTSKARRRRGRRRSPPLLVSRVALTRAKGACARIARAHRPGVKAHPVVPEPKPRGSVELVRFVCSLGRGSMRMDGSMRRDDARTGETRDRAIGRASCRRVVVVVVVVVA